MDQRVGIFHMRQAAVPVRGQRHDGPEQEEGVVQIVELGGALAENRGVLPVRFA